MKLIQHEGRPDIPSIKISVNPLRIWLGTRSELLIKKGDRLEDVAQMVFKNGPWSVDLKTSREIVGYWFGLGERWASGRVGKLWSDVDNSTDKDRRYLLKA